MDVRVLGVLILVALAAIVVIVLRSSARWVKVLAGFLVMGAVALGLVWFTGADDVEWTSVSYHGDTPTLAVTYQGGDCEQSRSVSIDEDDESVTITVTVRDIAFGSCSSVAREHTVLVTPDEPLGDREIRDGACVRPEDCVRTLR